MNDFAIVTGGSGAIGAEICRRLSDDGLRIIVIDKNEPRHDRVERFANVDTADAGALRGALAAACSGISVLRLVNNAGIVAPAALADADPGTVDAVMAVNVRASMICAQMVLPAMKAAKFGRIVNISSRSAIGKEERGAYSASKAALIGFTKTWALELARDGITVNAVAPGPIRTALFDEVNPPDHPVTIALKKRIPVGFMGEPEDVSHAVSYFVSSLARFVTGQVLFVCGGMTVGAA